MAANLVQSAVINTDGLPIIVRRPFGAMLAEMKKRLHRNEDRRVLRRMKKYAPNWEARFEDADLVFEVVYRIMSTKGKSL